MKTPNEILSAILDTNEKASLGIIREAQREAVRETLERVARFIRTDGELYGCPPATEFGNKFADAIAKLELPKEIQ